LLCAEALLLQTSGDSSSLSDVVRDCALPFREGFIARDERSLSSLGCLNHTLVGLIMGGPSYTHKFGVCLLRLCYRLEQALPELPLGRVEELDR
jgi:hypothetical protein